MEASYHFNETHDVSGAVAPLEGGGFFHGGGTVSAGDSEVYDGSGTFYSDGEHFWNLEWGDFGKILREVDPRSDKKGRESMPSVLEQNLATNWELELDESHLLGLDV